MIEQDVTRTSHRDAVGDLVRKGRDVEKIVLSRAVRWHLEDRVLVTATRPSSSREEFPAVGFVVGLGVVAACWALTCAAWRFDQVAEGVKPLEPRDFARLTLLTLGTGGAYENPARRGAGHGGRAGPARAAGRRRARRGREPARRQAPGRPAGHPAAHPPAAGEHGRAR